MNADAVLRLARTELCTLVPYSSARMEASEARVMLNANETPWTTPGDKLDLNRYPQPQPRALRSQLAALYEVASEQVLIARGSDEAIDLLVRAFCHAGKDAVLVCPPTFGMYAICASIQDARVVEVPLDEQFGLDPERVQAACDTSVKLVFVCSPNNPTGGGIGLRQIEMLATALTGRAVIVVDEAYIEFADSLSASTLLSRCSNIAVLRTLSKAWALAGARIGTLLAHPDVVALLQRIMPPYPIPSPCSAAALEALQSSATMNTRIGVIKRERERLSAALKQLTGVLKVLPSSANFVTVFFSDAPTVFRRLQDDGIVVRELRRYPRLVQALRITIGTPQQNDSLIAALNAIDMRGGPCHEP